MSVAPLRLQAMILKISGFCPQSWVPSWKKKKKKKKKTDPSWHSQQSKPGRSASRRRWAASEHGRKNFNLRSKVCWTLAKHSQCTSRALNHDPSRVARNKTTRPTQYPAVLGHTWWASSSRWCHLPRHEDRNTPIHEAGNAPSHTWNTPRNCKV